jgi:nucleotide-binding universal stress UspA family protein
VVLEVSTEELEANGVGFRLNSFCRAFLGSVSDYCAHHAHCSVMIVKQPKPKK